MRKKSFFLLVLSMLIISPNLRAEIKTTFGSAIRLRHEYLRNNTDMSHQRFDNLNYFRIKTSFWSQLEVDQALNFFLKFTNENRPYTYRGSTTGNKDWHYDIHELAVDNFYGELRNLFDSTVDIRLGRQDLLYGEGFLIADGTPSDGSRTYYFNALTTKWRFNETNTLDLLYIYNPRDDQFFPVLNEDKSPQALNVTKEEAYAFYLKSMSFKPFDLETYYIYKKEGVDGGKGYQAEKGIINTLGSFLKYTRDSWVLRGQIASQWGKYGLNDRLAQGGYVFIDKNFPQKTWTPTLTAGYAYLSGDDKDTSKNEGWDPVFSRFPWLSELYGALYTAEAGIHSYWTNLHLARASLTLKPTEKMKLFLAYNYLWADEYPSPNMALSITGTGKNRGHLPQVQLSYSFTKNISAYILCEYLAPGNFYKNSADSATFLRTQFEFKF